MSRPRLLDLFCCEGGAGMGYARAGFEVVGVDIVPRQRYPFAFVLDDAIAFLDRRSNLAGFDAIHASPPCQGYTGMVAPGQKGAPRLIRLVREMLAETGLPYIIENVEGARDEMRDPITLCGTMFGLGAQGFDLQRHRLFEASFPVSAPSPCNHARPVVGVYGGHARNRSAIHGGRGTRDVWEGGHRAAASEAMGMDWATLNGMSEAIPPAYTEHLGRQLLAHLTQQSRAA